MDLVIQIVELLRSLAALAKTVIEAVTEARGKRPGNSDDRK